MLVKIDLDNITFQKKTFNVSLQLFYEQKTFSLPHNVNCKDL
jgi:hypothetical protein